MTTAPSTDNYTLGKGIVYFDMKDPSTGLYSGYRDLGDASQFTTTLEMEKLAHISHRGGLASKDLEIVSQVTPSISLILDEPSIENTALQYMATFSEATQLSGYVENVAYTAYHDRRITLAHRGVGSIVLAISSPTGEFDVGETITGGTSAATAKVVTYTATGLVLVNIVGDFEIGETITGGTSTETATVTAIPVFNYGYVKVQNSAHTTTYVAGTDYQISTAVKDDKIGRILILPTGAITDGQVLHITYSYAACTYNKLSMFKNTVIEGRLKFVSFNPVGPDRELELWRVSIAPEGEYAYVGEEWSTINLTGEVLKDSEGHPDDPYGVIYQDFTYTSPLVG